MFISCMAGNRRHCASSDVQNGNTLELLECILSRRLRLSLSPGSVSAKLLRVTVRIHVCTVCQCCEGPDVCQSAAPVLNAAGYCGDGLTGDLNTFFCIQLLKIQLEFSQQGLTSSAHDFRSAQPAPPSALRHPSSTSISFTSKITSRWCSFTPMVIDQLPPSNGCLPGPGSPA
jgi:hypothetical protein